MTNLEKKLITFLQYKVKEKWAYEICQEWLDDIANDYDMSSFVITWEWLDVDMMSDDRLELLETLFDNRWFAIDIVDWVMYIDWKAIDTNITNTEDLLNVLYKI